MFARSPNGYSKLKANQKWALIFVNQEAEALSSVPLDFRRVLHTRMCALISSCIIISVSIVFSRSDYNTFRMPLELRMFLSSFWLIAEAISKLRKE